MVHTLKIESQYLQRLIEGKKKAEIRLSDAVKQEVDMITDWRTLNLQSLDIILCSGNGSLSKKIQWFQRLMGAEPEAAMLSHVASVDDTIIPAVMESTTLNKWADKTGVQINPLSEWLDNYDGRVWVRQLDFVRTVDFRHEDYRFWLKHKNDKYENGIPGYLELLLCGMRLHRYVRKIPCMAYYTPKFTTEPHCTELNAKRILAHDLWSRPIAINRMPPYIWQSIIDNWLKVPIGPMVLIKD